MATKLCPMCAEEIQEAAIKCKHCQSMIGQMGQNGPVGQAGRFGGFGQVRPADSTPSYFKLTGMVIAFFCVGPFMLPLIWLNPNLDTQKRLIATGVVVGITVPLVWAVVRAVGSLLEYYETLSRIGL